MFYAASSDFKAELLTCVRCSGAFGAVYKARLDKTTPVAVKMLKPEHFRDKELAERSKILKAFENEVDACGSDACVSTFCMLLCVISDPPLRCAVHQNATCMVQTAAIP